MRPIPPILALALAVMLAPIPATACELADRLALGPAAAATLCDPARQLPAPDWTASIKTDVET